MAESNSSFGKSRLSRNIQQWALFAFLAAMAAVFAFKYGASNNAGMQDRLAKEKKEEMEKIRAADTGNPDELKREMDRQEAAAIEKKNAQQPGDPTAPPASAFPKPGASSDLSKLPPPRDPSLAFDEKSDADGISDIDKYEKKKLSIRARDYNSKSSKPGAGGGEADGMLAVYENFGSSPSSSSSDLPHRVATDLRNLMSPEGKNSAIVNGTSKEDSNKPAKPDDQKPPQSDAQKKKDAYPQVAPSIKPMIPASSYVVTEGTVLNGVLLTAVNSQLPGRITAQVTQDVYDSAHGDILLIPRGSKLIGDYLSEVEDGHDRLLMAFNRLIYPSGASVSLGEMGASDAIGRAGVRGESNTHFWQSMASSFIIAGISKLAEGKTTTVGSFGTTTQTGAETTAGKILSDQAKKNLDKYSNMKTEIDVRPGEKINLVVAKDLDLPPSETFKDY